MTSWKLWGRPCERNGGAWISLCMRWHLRIERSSREPFWTPRVRGSGWRWMCLRIPLSTPCPHKEQDSAPNDIEDTGYRLACPVRAPCTYGTENPAQRIQSPASLAGSAVRSEIAIALAMRLPGQHDTGKGIL